MVSVQASSAFPVVCTSSLSASMELYLTILIVTTIYNHSVDTNLVLCSSPLIRFSNRWNPGNHSGSILSSLVLMKMKKTGVY